MATSERWRRGQHGWPAAFPLVQAPNGPLIVALVAWVVATLSRGDVRDVSRAVFLVALAVWAWEELSDGVNWFRRLLGAGGLVLVVVGIVEGL